MRVKDEDFEYDDNDEIVEIRKSELYDHSFMAALVGAGVLLVFEGLIWLFAVL